MNKWLENLTNTVKRKKSEIEAIEKRLPEAFGYLIKEIEEILAQLNAAVFENQEGYELSKVSDYYYSITSLFDKGEVDFYFSFKEIKLFVEYPDKEWESYETILDQEEGLRFDNRSGKLKAADIAQRIIERFVKHEFNLH